MKGSQITEIVSAVAVVLGLVFVGLELNQNSTPQRIAAQEEAVGTLAPSGPPSQPPRRVDAGGACIVDLEQRYEVSGTLTGRLVADYRILVRGPCGTPPGTVAEQWIAHGTFEGTVQGQTASATFWYTARVRAEGAVDGEMVFGGGIRAELKVTGRFSDGYLSYAGRLGSPAIRPRPQPGLEPVQLNHAVLALDRTTCDGIRYRRWFHAVPWNRRPPTVAWTRGSWSSTRTTSFSWGPRTIGCAPGPAT